MKTPFRPHFTELALRVLRCRLSRKETQAQFAEHFRVSKITVYNWERGKSTRIQKIYKAILVSMEENLRRDGRMLPEEAIRVLFKEREEALVAAEQAVNAS